MLEWYERITGGGSDSKVDLWNNDRGIQCYEDRRNIQACTAAKARSGAYQYVDGRGRIRQLQFPKTVK